MTEIEGRDRYYLEMLWQILLNIKYQQNYRSLFNKTDNIIIFLK